MKLALEQVYDLVDEPYYSRGKVYFKDGIVKIASISDSEIRAKVRGSRVYKVKITMQDGYLDGDCSCPAFEDFGPCKHIAATCFAAIEQQKGVYTSSKQCDPKMTELDGFEPSLRKKTKQELIEIIVRLSDYCPEIIDEINDNF